MSEIERTIDYGERGTVHILADPDALAAEAASRAMALAAEVIAARGVATVALSGGSTPKKMGVLLGDLGRQHGVDWSKVQVFWGDERWEPLESPESNAGEAKRGYLDELPIPAANVHPFQTTGVSPEESAAAYEALVGQTVPLVDGVPRFDLIILGMGDDGHTASLFPGTQAMHETDRLVIAHVVPKLDATRLTFTPPLIDAARHVLFLVGGEAKVDRLAEVLDGPIEIDRLPSQVVRPTSGDLTWLVDRAAAARLARNA